MEDFIGTYGNRLIIAVVGVGVALLLLAIVLWFIRRRSGSSPFIRGGKNRQPRLQVLDATAVDARRRLVLVRRDNVEHLVMIGGPSDIVIESGIGAIPFMKDVPDPQDEALPAPAQDRNQDRAISVDRQKSISQTPREDLRPVEAPATARAPVNPPPQTEPRQPNVAPAAPRPVTVIAPKPSVPVTATVVTPPSPAPQRPQASAPVPSVSAVVPGPAPALGPASGPAPVMTPSVRETAEQMPQRAATRDAVAPTVPAMTPAAVAMATLAENAVKPVEPAAAQAATIVPVVEPQPAPTPLSVVTSEPFEPRETSLDRDNAVDFLDAARERVLPTYRATPPMTATVSTHKPEPLAPGDSGTVFGDQLTSDFESFLEAEIAKNNSADAPMVSLDATPRETQPEPKLSDSPLDPADRDAQKEMARIFGEMSVTRDR